MTEAEKRALGSIMIAWLMKHGRGRERDLVIGHDTYKPLYRAVSLFFAPTLGDHDGLARLREAGATMTLDEAADVFRLAHPFFAAVVRHERDAFESRWKDTKEAWK